MARGEGATKLLFLAHGHVGDRRLLLNKLGIGSVERVDRGRHQRRQDKIVCTDDGGVTDGTPE